MSSDVATNLSQEMEKILQAELAMRHSYFQLKYFVIGKEPTTQAKLWQCLRELKSRQEALTALNLEIEEAKDQIELNEIQLQRQLNKSERLTYPLNQLAMSELDEKEHFIGVRRLQRRNKAALENLKKLEEKKNWLEDEARFFVESYKNLEKVEKLKPFDDLETQKQYWGAKFSEKINLKMLLQSPLDIELIESILALPDDIPVKTQMVNRLNKIQEHLLEVKEQYRKQLTNKG